MVLKELVMEILKKSKILIIFLLIANLSSCEKSSKVKCNERVSGKIDFLIKSKVNPSCLYKLKIDYEGFCYLEVKYKYWEDSLALLEKKILNDEISLNDTINNEIFDLLDSTICVQEQFKLNNSKDIKLIKEIFKFLTCTNISYINHHGEDGRVYEIYYDGKKRIAIHSFELDKFYLVKQLYELSQEYYQVPC